MSGSVPSKNDCGSGGGARRALSVAYGAGLRVSEVVSLKVSDIDSKRMMLRVEQGKGGKDRHAMLSPQLLELLRDWWRISRPQVWLFPGMALSVADKSRCLEFGSHKPNFIPVVSKLAYFTNAIFS